jgi:hypothetical protein
MAQDASQQLVLRENLPASNIEAANILARRDSVDQLLRDAILANRDAFQANRDAMDQLSNELTGLTEVMRAGSVFPSSESNVY